LKSMDTTNGMEQLKWLKDGCNWLVTVTAGVIVASATFYTNIVGMWPKAVWTILLGWFFLFLSIIGGVICYFSTFKRVVTKDYELKWNSFVGWSYNGMFLFFLLGMAFMVFFIIYNKISGDCLIESGTLGKGEWKMVTNLILFFTLLAIVWYAWEARKLAMISSDNLRISTLPGLKCEVTNFNENNGIGNILFTNRSDKPCFFWLQVRGFRVNTQDDWTKSPSELVPLRREPDPLGYYDGAQRRFMQPDDKFEGVFSLDEIGAVLREGKDVAVETLLWVTSDNRVITKDNAKSLRYDPKRWILRPSGAQPQTRIQLIF